MGVCGESSTEEQRVVEAEPSTQDNPENPEGLEIRKDGASAERRDVEGDDQDGVEPDRDREDRRRTIGDEDSPDGDASVKRIRICRAMSSEPEVPPDFPSVLQEAQGWFQGDKWEPSTAPTTVSGKLDKRAYKQHARR